jgi:hypothetical protein
MRWDNKGFCNIITTLDVSKLYIAFKDQMRDYIFLFSLYRENAIFVKTAVNTPISHFLEHASHLYFPIWFYELKSQYMYL